MENLYMTPKLKMSNTKLKLSDLNPHLMCVLCGGYYIDATTIVECLHSFCRSCIVKHLESSKYCPICEVQVHKTKPLVNIRPDKTLQDIVYKLVPELFSNEMRNRRRFYKERPHYIKPSDSESAGEVSGERKIYVNDENITFSLVYHVGPVQTSLEGSYEEISTPVENERRYFKCPTGVTVHHLKKLLRAKYDLSENNYKMEFYFKDQPLHEDFTLLDISYIYLWKSKGSLDLTYKIFENVVKRQKVEETEKGIVGVPEPEMNLAQQDPSVPDPAAEVPAKPRPAEEEKKEKEAESEEAKEKESKAKAQPAEAEESKAKAEEAPKPKENGVSGGEPKEVQLQISESGVMSVSQVEDGGIVRTVEESAAKVSNYQIITGLGVNKEVKGNGEIASKQPETGSARAPEKKPAPKAAKPYKTIRCSPKTWHPVIPKEKLRPTLMKNSDEPKKPLKFFKMRNMPRFLGNPSSGVKPMYAETVDNHSEEKKKPEERKSDAGKSLNKILKIDPKTLRPIEKEEMKLAPNAPNLLTNPFIPNNNHFLFGDLHLLPPNTTAYAAKPDPRKDDPAPPPFKSPAPNGTYPPVCFPAPDHSNAFYPFSKAPAFPFPVSDKMDPLLRASRFSPFANLAGFNVAGFHASLPPSISRLIDPHHHFRKISQSLDKKNKEESTKETSKSCDDSLKVSKVKEEKEAKRGEEKTDEPKKKKEEKSPAKTTTPTNGTEEKKDPSEGKAEIPEKEEPEKGDEEKKKKEETNEEGERRSNESACKPEVNKTELTDSLTEKEKDKDKDR